MPGHKREDTHCLNRNAYGLLCVVDPVTRLGHHAQKEDAAAAPIFSPLSVSLGSVCRSRRSGSYAALVCKGSWDFLQPTQG